LVLFAVAAVVSFAFPFFKEGIYKQLTWRPDRAAFGGFAAVILPFLILLGAGQVLKIGAGDSLCYLAVGAAVPFVLTRLSIPARLIGVLVLAVMVLLSWFFKDAGAAPACFALLAGLTVWKSAENLLLKAESNLEDILPASIWLVGLNWIRTVLPQAHYESREGLLLGTLAVVMLLRVLQTPLLPNDKLYIKRFMLAATGGLGLLIVITKLLVAPQLSSMAVLVGAGIFVAYLFDAMHSSDERSYGPMEAISALVIVGIMTLVASRLFGNYGLLILAPTMLVGRTSSYAHAAALFLVTRALLQGYVYNFVPNVTGINIMHAYTAAALFAGFLIPAVISVSIRDLTDRRWLITIFLAASALTPLFSNFFLHEEPTGSLLVSATVAALVFVTLGPVLYRQLVPGHENVLLVPTQMTTFALLSSGLIGLGNEGTGEAKIKILLYCAAVVLVISMLLYWLFARSGRKPVEVSGN
jgi:hypothetical protein